MLNGFYQVRIFAKITSPDFQDVENSTYFNLTILNKFILNPKAPEFIEKMPDFVVEANTTRSFKLPEIVD